MIKNNTLSEKLKSLGYPLLEKEDGMAVDVNATLAEVVQSQDLRLWEGFPLVLANSAEKKLFDYDMVCGHLKNPLEKSNFSELVLMSLALYKVLRVQFAWTEQLYASLNAKTKKLFEGMFEKIKSGNDLHVGGRTVSSERLKNTFRNYYKQETAALSELTSLKEEFSLEYGLSQVFSPKQKELFFKKLKGEKMSKTEKEYYSRVVRKKVEALANVQLHQLAQKIR